MKLIKKILVSVLIAGTGLMFSKDFKGAEIYSNQSWKYGKMEMRMRMAKGDGILSTFFTYKNGSEVSGTFWEEIDIEVFGKNNAQTFQSNIITNNPRKYSEEVHSPGYSMGDDYHTFKLEWTPDYVAWYIDDVVMRKSTGAQVKELTNSQSFRFNLWAANITSWVGTFNGNSLPVYQYVNWIRYSKYTPGTGENGTDFTSDWTDDFNTFNTTRWSKANWTFNENLVDFDPNNVVVKDGYLVLALTKAGQTGFTGSVPVDKESNKLNVPTISFTYPFPNTNYCSTSSINLKVDANASTSTIKKVEYYDGGVLIGTSTQSPYSFNWLNPSQGNHTIKAIVTSGASINSIQSVVSFSVVPKDNSCVSGLNKEILNVEIHPNPVTNSLLIDSAFSGDWKIIDEKGAEIMTGKAKKIDLSTINSGTYLIVIDGKTTKFIKE
jgi:hypothetical protein